MTNSGKSPGQRTRKSVALIKMLKRELRQGKRDEAWTTGEIYLAQDTQLGRKLALKLLPIQITTDADRLRRFEQKERVAKDRRVQREV